jgi:predicted metalloprotease with PDZ domain
VATPIRYEVDLRDRVQHLVRVTLTVPADLAAGGRVVLPVWTPGSYVVRNYVHHVQWIRAVDETDRAVPLEADTVTSWRLPDDADGEVAVTYELYANELTVRTNHVDDHHALLIPAATFAYVEGGEDRPHEVHLPAPEGERVQALLPPGPQPDTYVAEHRDHLVDSAFEVGDHPYVDVEVAGVPHRFVWSGHGGDPELDRRAEEMERIAEATIALFEGDLPVERYTFLCTGWDQGGGGLEHRDGSVLQIPVRAFQDPELLARFQSLLAHEYFHLWNVKRLVPAALVQPDYEHPTRSPSLWVAEGWTAYYDELLPLRAGVWSVRRFLDTLRDTEQRINHETPGVVLQSLRQASLEAWTKHYIRDENSPNVMTDYYGHGALVACELDLRLRAADPQGAGLDAVLRLLWARHAHDPSGYTEQDVLDAVAQVGGADLAALAERRVAAPGPVDLDEPMSAVGLTWTSAEGPTPPSLGATTQDSDTDVTIAHVLRDGPAWRAGITGGDRLLAIDGRTVARGELAAVLLTHEAGQEVEVAVARGPRLLRLPVTLGAPRPGRRLVAVDRPSTQQAQAFRAWTAQPLEQARAGTAG